MTTRQVLIDLGQRQRYVSLADIANEHANSRVLSKPTKAYFARLAQRGRTDVTEVEWAEAADAYFEAAASCSTRGAQSRERRLMAARLNRLRDADLAGEAIGPEVHSYSVVVADEVEGTLTVTMDHDGTVSTLLDVDLRALRNV